MLVVAQYLIPHSKRRLPPRGLRVIWIRFLLYTSRFPQFFFTVSSLMALSLASFNSNNSVSVKELEDCQRSFFLYSFSTLKFFQIVPSGVLFTHMVVFDDRYLPRIFYRSAVEYPFPSLPSHCMWGYSYFIPSGLHSLGWGINYMKKFGVWYAFASISTPSGAKGMHSVITITLYPVCYDTIENKRTLPYSWRVFFQTTYFNLIFIRIVNFQSGRVSMLCVRDNSPKAVPLWYR